MPPDRDTPGIEAAVRALFAWWNDGHECDPMRLDEEISEVVVAAFLAAEPPADVLRALLEAQPEAFREALTEMLTSPRIVSRTAHEIHPRYDEFGNTGRAAWNREAAKALRAAVASLKPKEDECR